MSLIQVKVFLIRSYTEDQTLVSKHRRKDGAPVGGLTRQPKRPLKTPPSSPKVSTSPCVVLREGGDVDEEVSLRFSGFFYVAQD